MDGDPPLDRGGREQAAALRGHLPTPDRVWTSHAARSVETARLAGLDGGAADADLAEGDFGRWAGRTPLEVADEEPDVIAAWYADLGSAPHGGETFAQVVVRARRVLARAAALGGTTIAVTHGGLIRAALLGVLELPVTALWRLDAAPASVAELHPAGGAVAAATVAAGDRGVAAVVEAVEDAVPDDPGSWRVVRVNWTPRLAGVAPGVRAAGATHARGAHSPTDEATDGGGPA